MSDVEVVTCGCCGIPLFNSPRARLRRCEVCDQCDKIHGDALQFRVAQLVTAGKLDPGQAMTRMLIDDALVTGRLEFVGDAHAAMINIPKPPRRWEVAIGRAICRGEQPDLHSAIGAVLGEYFGRVWSNELRAKIERDVAEVLHVFDDSITGVDIDIDADVFDPEHAIIKVTATTPSLGATFDADAAGAIPADILSRPRGEA